ncbi:MAG: hypothetical protein WC829_23655 [Hyphomicrobium sp.]|jgi:preprotein translocase subunit SecY
MAQDTDATMWKRAGITLAVLGAYYLGSNVPLPGLDTEKLAQLARSTGPSALARVSIFSLGVMPLLSALVLLEIVKLFAPGVRLWERASWRHRDRMWLIATGLALAMALVQGAGIALALEDVSGIVHEPGTTFRATTIATLLAGTAVAIAFVGVIDRAGLGSGLWLLFLTPALASLPGTVATLAHLNARGEYTTGAVVLSALYAALSIAAVAGIVLAAKGARATVATCLWTPFVAHALMMVPVLAVGWIATSNVDGAVPFAAIGPFAWYLTLGACVVLATWLCGRSYARAGETSPVAVAPIAASLAAIVIAGAILEHQLGLVLALSSAQLIVAATVAAMILMRWGYIGSAAMLPEDSEPTGNG